MKLFNRYLAVLIIAFLPAFLFANAYVHGTVKNRAGAPVANYMVHITGDSALSGSNCSQSHIRYTNASGIYRDTLFCSSNMTNVTIWVTDAYGSLVQSRTFTANQVAEANFILRDSLVTCAAVFYQTGNTTQRQFFSSASHGTQPSDSIIVRQWSFGDGTSLNGNVVNPTHTYLTHGVFPVCLKIKTVSGCEKTFCQNVMVLNPLTGCEALYTYQFQPSSAGNFRVMFNSSNSHAAPGDSILYRTWSFGDGTFSTLIAHTHTYALPGTYTVCLTIVSAAGCRDTTCRAITIATNQPHCEAVFSIDSINTPPGGNAAYRYFRFNSANSHGAPASDSIIERKWNFGDGTGMMQGNQVSPVHGYAQPGVYNTCLYILTASGCRDTLCRTVRVYAPAPSTCHPRFTTLANALTVTFNSNLSTVAPGDSIVSRTWLFGDGSTSNSNAAVLTHQYPRAGVYRACLTIRTRSGCVATWCKEFAVVPVAGNCVPFFTKEQTTTPRTIRFNSIAAYSQIPNDSILIRKWEFGDGQTLLGNVVNPLHTYAIGGTYNVCLTIVTAHCDRRWCQTIQVLPIDTSRRRDSIHIANLYPVPVTAQLNAVIYSYSNNIQAELSIYDVYGVRKWVRNVVLPAGNSTHNIPTSQLPGGPYIFKVTTQFGVRSRNFYKL